MGIYIKGMEMPEYCDNCIFTLDDECMFNTLIDADTGNAIYDSCPLVEVAEPHRRLIEALEQEPIIHCKDCKHFVRDDVEEHTPYGFYNTYFHAFCDKHYDKEQGEYIDVKLDDFCSFAEQKESDEE